MDDQQGQNQEWIPSQISNEQLNQQPTYYQPSARQFQQPFYNQQTQYNQRQFQPPPYPQSMPQRKQNSLSRWYYKQPRKRKIGFWCGIILAALMFYSCVGSTCAMSTT